MASFNPSISLILFSLIPQGLTLGSFTRSKKKGNRTYYWIVESIREKDKVIQKPIRYIGSAENLLEKLKLLEELLKK